MSIRSEWDRFNPVMEDRRVSSLDDSIELASKLMQFCFYLRNADQASMDRELRRFFENGFVGPITSTARNISPALQMIWQYNSNSLYDSMVESPRVDSIFLLLLMNEFYYPINDSMPKYYTPIEVDYLGNSHGIGVVDRIKFAEEIEIKSVLIDAEIVESRKQEYHLDGEFSLYEIEYSYSWNNISYSNADVLKLNTAHLAWANRGGLLNFPKVDFDERDLDSKLSKGAKIQVYVASDNGLIRNPVYDDLVYEVAKM